MALDTRDKRASAIGCGLACLLLVPLADGALSALDRQHVAGVYRLAASLPVSGSAVRRHVRVPAATARTVEVQPDSTRMRVVEVSEDTREV